MKSIVSAVAMMSLFTTAPALASDVTSDRQLTETRGVQSRAVQSLKDTPGAGSHSPQDKKDHRACSCARSDAPQEIRGEPSRH